MKLYPYQRQGAEFLATHNHALLADEMGLGKTAQAVSAAKQVGAKTLCVICPAIARPMWHRELKIWGWTGASLIESYNRATGRKDVQDAIAKMKPEVLILDEAHYLKNRNAKRTRAIYGTSACGHGLIAHAKRVWLLTGTPTPNNASELWPHFRALFPKLIPSRRGASQNYWEFVNSWCWMRRTEFGMSVYGNRNPQGLRNLLRNFTLRRKSEQVLKDLPAITITHSLVEPTVVSQELSHFIGTDEYKRLEEIVEKALDEYAEPPNVPHLSTLRRLTGIAKAGAVAQTIAEELDAGAYSKIVLFGIHREALNALEQGLSSFECVRVDGATPPAARQSRIDQFQNEPLVRVFIGQLTACGHALTLTAAHHAALVEYSWTPAENFQATKRCHRIGQTRPVFVRMFGLANSIDEAISGVLAQKTRMLSELETCNRDADDDKTCTPNGIH